MLNLPIIKEEIQILKVEYFIHALLYILLSISQFLIYLKIYWLNGHLIKIFISEMYIICISSLYPIIIIILFIFLNLNEKIIKVLDIITIILLIIFTINGLLTSITILYDSLLVKPFYYDCPFNFHTDSLPNIISYFGSGNVTKIRNQCKYRRCFILNKNESNNTFICNFKEKNKDSEFFKIDLLKEILDNELNYYIIGCQNYTTFYKCIKYKHYNYSINDDFECPEKKEIYYNNVLCILFVFIELLASSTPWLCEHISFRKIKLLINLHRSISNRHNLSLKDTNNTSKLEDNNNINNSNNNNNINNNNNQVQQNNNVFERKPTELLIIENGNSNNINNINNENNDERIINIIKIKNKNLSDKENKKNISHINNEINNCEEINNSNSKSESQLMGKNGNIFKLMNQEIKPENDQNNIKNEK